MNQFDPQTKDLQDSIFLSKVRRAQQQSPGEKLMDGPRLFDLVCERMRDGIRHQFPGYDQFQVEAELRRRLQRKRAMDERGYYQSAGTIDG